MFDSGGIIPRLHLSNLRDNPAPVLALVSDSLGLPGRGPASCDQVSSLQGLWSALKDGFRRQNPQASFNFDTDGPDAGNFAIGGAGWQHVLKPGEASKFKLPAWFTTPSATWLSHARAVAPDVLVFNLGINHAHSGMKPNTGHNVLFHIGAALAEIATWEKTPNVLFITNKAINRAIVDGPGGFRPGPHESFLGVAAVLRSLARSHGALMTAGFPAILRRFGLIDIGRYYCASVLGKDVANQYFVARPEVVARARNLAVSPEAVRLGASTDGDFAFTLKFPAQGAGVIHARGIRHILIQLGAWSSQVLSLHFQNAEGGLRVTYMPVHATSPHQLSGPALTLPAGDFGITVECRQERLCILINGAPYLCAAVPRFIAGGPITLYSLEAPSTPPVVTVTAFYDGRALSCTPAMSEDSYYGAYGNDAITTGGPYGGNGGNHPGSAGVALTDYAAIAACNLAAPA